ncbi:tRNA (adenosine(37)-N6)-dimethylallyltransferase MiaA [Methylovirgula sp. 4M-Z18]|uniref:tRNA (adenosine(37)-N6)-dimethylallyltransferase MiaA n=1 Tax=Methylovirgula sp. 4M-Z18 TaxID=2293567 RepID=UPI00403F12C6
MSLARTLGGVVINADSMQVYRDLYVLSARPTPEEQAGIPHLLFGHVDGAINYSVGKFLIDAAAALQEARAAGKVSIFCGGTGMYFKALTQGLSDIPPVPEAVRASVRAEAEGLPPESLYQRLKAHDALSAARLNPTDPQRILRALEVFAATGKSLTSFQNARQAPLLRPGTWRGLFLAPDRAALYDRIDHRFTGMVQSGALDETEALKHRNLDPALPVMRAHGVPGLIDYLNGAATLEDAIARGQADTRHYAKRQFTFARHQLPEFEWASLEEAEAVLLPD